MILCHMTKLTMNLSQLSRLNLGSMLSGHRIKSYGLIECDKLYPLTDVNDKFPWSFFMLVSPYEKSGVNSIFAQQ
jgi:hypothetical protein